MLSGFHHFLEFSSVKLVKKPRKTLEKSSYAQSYHPYPHFFCG